MKTCHNNFLHDTETQKFSHKRRMIVFQTKVHKNKREQFMQALYVLMYFCPNRRKVRIFCVCSSLNNASHRAGPQGLFITSHQTVCRHIGEDDGGFEGLGLLEVHLCV